MEMSLSARFSPYQSETWSISTIGISMIPAALAWTFRLATTLTSGGIPSSSSTLASHVGAQPPAVLRLARPLHRRHSVRPAQAVAQPDPKQVQQHDDRQQQERRDENHRTPPTDGRRLETHLGEWGS